MIFLGFLFDKTRINDYKKNIKSGWFEAGNLFQWNIIDGFIDNGLTDLKIANFVPVGAWPRAYKKLFLPSCNWKYKDVECCEFGSINIPFFKQKQRENAIYKFLKKQKNGEDIFVFSPNLIFLNALKRLKKKGFKVTMLITDIPEFYDLSTKKMSLVRRIIAKKSNKLLHIADKYILLTEQMAQHLHIDKPYLVIESIVNPGEAIKGKKIRNKTILYSGLLHERFGIKNLVDAFLEIADPDYKLVLCGDGDYKESIEQIAKQDDRIEYKGVLTREEVLKLQREATVLVNPRQNNDEFTKFSFPSKTVEYMLAERPVIMYKLDGIPDEYDEYLCYVEGKDLNSLKDKIVEVVNLSVEQQSKIGEKARDFVVKNKNRSIQAKKIINFIKE